MPKETQNSYGYDPKTDRIIISKDGTIGEEVTISDLKIVLPARPMRKHMLFFEKEKSEQRWVREEWPRELLRVRTMEQWNEMPETFKVKYRHKIKEEFRRREEGVWMLIKGEPVYITGENYFYIQWCKIDVGYPCFRFTNRKHFLFWEACQADQRCFGELYVKNRRSGFSFESSSTVVEGGTKVKDKLLGIVSKTSEDAKSFFMKKTVPMVQNLPFFFKPILDGTTNPRNEIAFREPAKRISGKHKEMEAGEGLNTVINHKPTSLNSYDSEKLFRIILDEFGKFPPEVPADYYWTIVRTCLLIGRKIVGKARVGSTVNELGKGGLAYQNLWDQSNPKERDKNGRTMSGLYRLFIPAEENLEGFFDSYGRCVLKDPLVPILGEDGEMITQGAITYLDNIESSLRESGRQEDLMEHLRQFPRIVEHAFIDSSLSAVFNQIKIQEQHQHNDYYAKERIRKGNFIWKNGIKDTEVLWVDDNINGKFLITWMPPVHMRNQVLNKHDVLHPVNSDLGCFGIDPYKATQTSDTGSNGSMHGMTMPFHTMGELVDTNFCFLEYISRATTVYDYMDDMIKAMRFYSMPAMIENNVTELLREMKTRNLRHFALNRPDRPAFKLTGHEKELGGIPTTGADISETLINLISAYIEHYVGISTDATIRPKGDMGAFYFNRTLEDLRLFNPAKRTKRDASMSFGLALIGSLRYRFRKKQETKNNARAFRALVKYYDNKGQIAKRISS